MASTSANSSVQRSNVFLSFRGEETYKNFVDRFRGEDTRNNFVDHLYHDLQHKIIHTYKDDQRIKKGKGSGDELTRSIIDSRFYIIVLSKNDASSSWCLDELVKIMECQKTSDQTACTVFYGAEPTEVCKQSGSFGKAFSKLEKLEAGGKWREAIKEATDLNTLNGFLCLNFRRCDATLRVSC